MKTSKTKRPNIYSRKTLLMAGAGLVLLLIILEATNTTHLLHKEKVASLIPAKTQTNNQTNSPNSSSSTATSSPSQKSFAGAPSSSNSSGSSLPLVAPYGDFVSNHKPGQNGTPLNETSVCNTTPGASCYLKFTKVGSGATSQLSTQTVGSDGSVRWDWNVDSDAHLTSGEWQILAIATLNGHTLSTTDKIKLTIQ